MEKRTSSTVIFQKRKTFVSELYNKDANVRSVCQTALMSGIFSLIAIVIKDSIDAERFYWHSFATYFDFPSTSCLTSVICIDLFYHLLMISIHPLFHLWIRSRSLLLGRLADLVFIGLYITIVLASFVFNVWACVVMFNFPGYIRIILTVEQLRAVMKSYSFIRENAYKVLYPWHKDDVDGPAVWYKGQMSPTVGSFKQYCYFLFAPTILYRDHYPRDNGPINWTSVMTNFCLFIIGLTIAFEIYTSAYVDNFRWTSIVLSYVSTLPLSLVLLSMATTSTIHGYMNLWAELLRFGDRLFYEDWWTSTKYQEYYRKWNIIPYHFNHQYIYKDIRKVTSSVLFSVFFLILISSIVHEYIIAVTLGFIQPTLTIFFAGVGVFVMVSNLGSYGMLLSLFFGFHIIIWSYITETSARRLCPREELWIDLIYPRSIECFMNYN